MCRLAGEIGNLFGAVHDAEIPGGHDPDDPVFFLSSRRIEPVCFFLDQTNEGDCVDFLLWRGLRKC
jgi:hypothetical protein